MFKKNEPQEQHLHLISDSSGETVEAVARACLSQFRELEAKTHSWMLIRGERHIEKVIEGIRKNPGPVLYTLVDKKLCKRINAVCEELSLPSLPVLDPVIHDLAQYYGMKSINRPGLQHELDKDYFHRIEAMDFALSHDDGHLVETLQDAEVVLTGVSRTSKTPTCLYLANRGVKAANIPLITGMEPPGQLFALEDTLVIGLTKDPMRLVQIRRNRLASMGAEPEGKYADLEAVREELMESRRLFARHDWPVIDVTKRSIEETAAAILTLLAERHNGNGITAKV